MVASRHWYSFKGYPSDSKAASMENQWSTRTENEEYLELNNTGLWWMLWLPLLFLCPGRKLCCLLCFPKDPLMHTGKNQHLATNHTAAKDNLRRTPTAAVKANDFGSFLRSLIWSIPGGAKNRKEGRTEGREGQMQRPCLRNQYKSLTLRPGCLCVKEEVSTKLDVRLKF